jgi:hypothetical protein
MDGKTVVDQTIVTYEYTPEMGYLKEPLDEQSHGLPFPEANTSMLMHGTGVCDPRGFLLNVANVVPTASAQIQATIQEDVGTQQNTAATNHTYTIYSPIEKDQILYTGPTGTKRAATQPSLHIGIQPVPALTTTSTLAENAQFNSWTDSRAYWDVTCTMVVDEYQPTQYPFASLPNVRSKDVVYTLSAGDRPLVLTNPRDDGATYLGLYTNKAAPFPKV